MNIKDRTIPNLEGAGVILKPPVFSDMKFIQWLWRDPDTMKPVGGPVILTDEQASQWFGRKINPGSPTDCYLLIFNETDEPVGEISFHRFNIDTKTAEFNIKIASDERGKGYAQKAMTTFLDYYFNHYGGEILVDDVAADNEKGQQLLSKFGFDLDSRIKDLKRFWITQEKFNKLYKFQKG